MDATASFLNDAINEIKMRIWNSNAAVAAAGTIHKTTRIKILQDHAE